MGARTLTFHTAASKLADGESGGKPRAKGSVVLLATTAEGTLSRLRSVLENRPYPFLFCASAAGEGIRRFHASPSKASVRMNQ